MRRNSHPASRTGLHGTQCMGGCRTGTTLQPVGTFTFCRQSPAPDSSDCHNIFPLPRPYLQYPPHAISDDFRHISHARISPSFNLLASDCMELTLELNERKWPDLPRLAEMWEENAKAFVKYPSIAVLGGEDTAELVGKTSALL